jgi:hypothetical protein
MSCILTALLFTFCAQQYSYYSFNSLPSAALLAACTDCFLPCCYGCFLAACCFGCCITLPIAHRSPTTILSHHHPLPSPSPPIHCGPTPNATMPLLLLLLGVASSSLASSFRAQPHVLATLYIIGCMHRLA